MQIGKVAKVPIILTGNLLVYAAILCGVTAVQSGITTAAWMLLAIVAVSGIVLLHEIGHTLAGQHYGVRTRSITLNFYGGMAGADPVDWYYLMDRPKEAMIIWACGPLVNVVLYGVLTGVMYLLPSFNAELGWLRMVNLYMACFNLLPIYPTDGGGILYSFCRFFTTKQRAIRIASIVSMIGCVVLMVFAVKYRAFVAGVILIMVFLTAYRSPKSDLFKTF